MKEVLLLELDDFEIFDEELGLLELEPPGPSHGSKAKMIAENCWLNSLSRTSSSRQILATSSGGFLKPGPSP